MKELRIHYFQHVPFEGLGSIEEWAKKNDHYLSSTHLYNDDKMPGISDLDWLIIMGGPMSVHDEEQYPWLIEEKLFIRQAVEAGKKVLGICLGSQLISSALGANVYRNTEKEIGWFDIQFSTWAQNSSLFSHMGKSLKTFHWHGDTFDLPERAILLASSAGCKNQAYIYKEKVLALQFHPEPTMQSLQQMIENGENELRTGSYIQTDKEFLLNEALAESNRKVLFTLLDRFAE
jgi:GMP synthase-like glutamine amidotransferase